MKQQLDEAKGAWPKKLPNALWAIRTSFRTSTGENPFSFTFGSEAVIRVEIGEASYQTATFSPECNKAQLALNLDLVKDRRMQANLRNEAYKRVSRYYDSRVKPHFSKSTTGSCTKYHSRPRTQHKEPWAFPGRVRMKSYTYADLEHTDYRTRTVKPKASVLPSHQQNDLEAGTYKDAPIQRINHWRIIHQMEARKKDILSKPKMWITSNYLFMGIAGTILTSQFIIIEFLGKAFSTVALNQKEWQFSLTLGFVEMLFAIILFVKYLTYRN
ncbi:unnamed protein product [Prunus armeniaca]